MRTFVVMAGVVLLTACSEEQTARLQQQASAAIGGVHQVVQDSSAPLAELKQQASAVLGDGGKLKQQASAAIGVAKRVGEAAAVFDPELGEQIDQAKQAADILQGKQ